MGAFDERLVRAEGAIQTGAFRRAPFQGGRWLRWVSQRPLRGARPQLSGIIL